MPVAVAIVLGLAAGLAAGGQFTGLEATRLKYTWMILFAFLIQGLLRGRLGVAASADLGLLVWTLVSLLLAAAVLANRRYPTLGLVGIGTLLNALVVMLNGHMPVFPGASENGLKVSAALTRSAGFYQLGTASTVCPVLADVVPLSVGSSTYFLSAGDLVLMGGVAAFVIGRMIEAPRAS